MVTFPMTLTDPNPVFKVTAFLKSNIRKVKVTFAREESIPKIWNGTMFGDFE